MKTVRNYFAGGPSKSELIRNRIKIGFFFFFNFYCFLGNSFTEVKGSATGKCSKIFQQSETTNEITSHDITSQKLIVVVTLDGLFKSVKLPVRSVLKTGFLLLLLSSSLLLLLLTCCDIYIQLGRKVFSPYGFKSFFECLSI